MIDVNIGPLIARKLNELNISKSDFARKLGIANQNVNRILEKKSIDTGKLVEISEALGYNFFKAYGEGAMFLSDKPATSDNPSIGQPYYDVDFEGGFMELTNSQACVPTTNIVVRGFEKADLWCNVTGHSMEPKISHGDIIALHRCTVDDVQYGEIYAVVLDTIRTIKILRKGSTPDSFLFVPINSDYDPQEYPKSRILNVFEVIGSISKFF